MHRDRRHTRKQRHARNKTQKAVNAVKAVKAWGYHLTVDAGNCNPTAIRSKKTIETFVKKLVSAIDMVAFGKPRIVMFGTGNKKGYTLVQLIETSNIMAHFTEETNDIYFDIFSCKSFSPKVALGVIDEYFNPARKHVRFMKRQA